MSTPYGWYFDIEADDLYLQSTKVWCIRLKSLDGTRQEMLYPFRMTADETYSSFMEWVYSFDDGALVVGHSILGYDVWVLWKLFSIVPRVGKYGKDWIEDKQVQFVDTYPLSMYLQPDAQLHSLKFLASGSEDEKMEFRAKLIELGVLAKDAPKGAEFKQWHPLMGDYCSDDVDAGLGVFRRLWARAEEMYGKTWLHPSFRQFSKDFYLYAAQAYTGVKFHKGRAEALIPIIEAAMADLKAQVDPELPPRPLKTAEEAFYRIPAKPWRKNGEVSATMEKWLEKHQARINEDGQIEAYGFKVPIKAGEILPVKMAMEISDNAELKQFFLDNGWKPTFWNYKKDPDTGKPMRDDKRQLIPTTPKIMQAQVICPNLLELSGEIPAKVVKFLSYRNRLGVVQGWLSNWRLEFDGRISAEISGFTPTFRAKHKTICNVPKADPKVLLGYEFRDLWTVDEGNWYIGADSASLENRTLAAYTFKHDNGEFAELILRGDSHTFNAFAFFPHLSKEFDINEPDLKEKKEFKPWRNKAKTGAYLLAYGGGVPKLASSLDLSPREAQNSYDNYWKANKGLGILKEKAEAYYNTVGKKKYLPAIDGRILSIRGKNVIINCLGQSCGAIAQSLAACLMDAKLGDLYIDELGRPYYLYKGKKVKRISLIHDEYSFEVEDGVQEEIRVMMVDCIIKGGELLKLDIPLDGEGKMARSGSWRDVH